MLHMNHRPPGSPPMPQQIENPRLGLRIVSPTESGQQDAFLLVNDDQCCVGLELHADFSHMRSSNFTHFSINSCYRQAIECKQDDLMPAVAVRPYDVS